MKTKNFLTIIPKIDEMNIRKYKKDNDRKISRKDDVELII
jgi:hypothetical protein